MSVVLFHYSPPIVTKGLSLNLKLVDVARSTGQQAPGFCLPLPSTEVTGTLPHLGFNMGAQNPNSSLLFAQKALYPLDYLPNPKCMLILLYSSSHWAIFMKNHPLLTSGLRKKLTPEEGGLAPYCDCQIQT